MGRGVNPHAFPKKAPEQVVDMPLEAFWCKMAQENQHIIIGDTGHINKKLHKYFGSDEFLQPLRQCGVAVIGIEESVRNDKTEFTVNHADMNSSEFRAAIDRLNKSGFSPKGSKAQATRANDMEVAFVDVDPAKEAQKFLSSVAGYSPEDAKRISMNGRFTAGFLFGAEKDSFLHLNPQERRELADAYNGDKWKATKDQFKGLWAVIWNSEAMVMGRMSGTDTYEGNNHVMAENYLNATGQRKGALVLGDGHMNALNGSDTNATGRIEHVEQDVNELVPNNVYVKVYSHEDPIKRKKDEVEKSSFFNGSIPSGIKVIASYVTGSPLSPDIPEYSVYLQTNQGGPKIVKHSPDR